MANKIKGDIIVDSYEHKLRIEVAAYECGYSVACEPQGNGEYRLTFYLSEITAKSK